MEYFEILTVHFSLDVSATTKALAGAKSLGNLLYSAVNKAGAKVSEASAKIKKTVEENVSYTYLYYATSGSSIVDNMYANLITTHTSY